MGAIATAGGSDGGLSKSQAISRLKAVGATGGKGKDEPKSGQPYESVRPSASCPTSPSRTWTLVHSATKPRSPPGGPSPCRQVREWAPFVPSPSAFRTEPCGRKRPTGPYRIDSPWAWSSVASRLASLQYSPTSLMLSDESGSQGTEMAQAQFGTVRTQLLNVAAQVGVCGGSECRCFPCFRDRPCSRTACPGRGRRRRLGSPPRPSLVIQAKEPVAFRSVGAAP